MGDGAAFQPQRAIKFALPEQTPLAEVKLVAKCRLREKELRRRRHRYWKRRKQRIKQAILEARMRKLEMKQQAAAAAATETGANPAEVTSPEASTAAATEAPETASGEAQP